MSDIELGDMETESNTVHSTNMVTMQTYASEHPDGVFVRIPMFQQFDKAKKIKFVRKVLESYYTKTAIGRILGFHKIPSRTSIAPKICTWRSLGQKVEDKDKIIDKFIDLMDLEVLCSIFARERSLSSLANIFSELGIQKTDITMSVKL